jgi:hypothetical protein
MVLPLVLQVNLGSQEYEAIQVISGQREMPVCHGGARADGDEDYLGPDPQCPYCQH